MNNTNTIVVTGSTGADELIISQAGGQFEPGADIADEGGGSPEIEFSINLGGGLDRFKLQTGNQSGTLVFGAGSLPFRRVAVNNDGDADLSLRGVEVLVGQGGSGTDRLTGQGGNGTGAPIPVGINLVGFGGNDSVIGGAADDGVTGGTGNDTVDGAAGSDSVSGNEDTDTVIGGPGDDLLTSGTSGDDTFVPGPGDDEMIGSTPGRQTVSFAAAPGPVNVSLGSGEATGEGTDTLSLIENVTGSNFGDSISGDAGRNLLNGRGGDDLLQGAQEADSLIPGLGTDDVRGGAGLDNVVYADSNVGVDVNLGAGTATAQGTDTISLVENITGSLLGDILTGSVGPNVISGLDGDDDIFGLAGDDVLDGGNGNDDLDGGPGNDLCGQGLGTGTLTSCETVGTFDLKPRDVVARVGEPIDYTLTWTHPRRWRRLDTVELRVRDGDRVLVWVRWNQEGNTFQIFRPGAGRFGPAAPGGSNGTLSSPFAVLHLRGSDAQALNNRTIAVTMRLAFRRAAIGDHIVEVTAQDDRNNRDAWHPAGTLRIR